MAKENLENGKALELFEKMVKFQGGDLSNGLPKAKEVVPVTASKAGFIQSMDVEKIGMASLHMGAGRLKTTDSIDPAVGIEMHIRPGQEIQKNDILCSLHINNSENTVNVAAMLEQAIEIGSNPAPTPELIKQVIRSK